MGRCTYCGRSAGFFRKMHSQCKVQHDTALVRIPEFFPRFFDSDLSPDRFCQLLQEGANASYIKLPELRDAVADGISAVIDRKLQERLLNEAEVKRFADVTEALGPILGGSDRLYEKLAKIDVLTELNMGRIPDVVSIEDELPIELQSDEQVIWVFNGVTAYRPRRSGINPQNSGLQLVLNRGAYYGPLAFDNINMPVEEFVELGRGDLIATNQNLIFLESDGDPRLIPLPKVAMVHTYAGAVRITAGEEWTRAFMLNDVWFAANLIVRVCDAVDRKTPEPLPSHTES